jgi:uncharacterized spore protein YtfJ
MIVSEILEQLGADLKNFADSNIVFGEPIELEGTKIVPMCKLSVGYGGGGGQGEGRDEKSAGGEGYGGGAGGGVSMEPVAVIVAKDGEVSVAKVGGKESKLKSLVDLIPEALEKIKGSEEESEEE